MREVEAKLYDHAFVKRQTIPVIIDNYVFTITMLHVMLLFLGTI